MDNTFFNPEAIDVRSHRIISERLETFMDVSPNNIGGYDNKISLALGSNPDSTIVRGDLTIRTTAHLRPQAVAESDTYQQSEENMVAAFEVRILLFAHVDGIAGHMEINREAQTMAVDEQMATSIAQVFYGTARGILSSRFASTIFRNHYLPVVDGRRLLEGEENSEESVQPQPEQIIAQKPGVETKAALAPRKKAPAKKVGVKKAR